MDSDILPILRDWGTRDLKSRTVETLLRDAADEIERLRTAGDALAAAVNDEHRPRFCEMGCPSRTAVEAWEEARRG